MKENKTMDAIHRGLLKKFHTLCSVLGMSDAEKCALLAGYDVESSRDLDTHALVDICGTLSAQADSRKKGNLDKLRKRAMAAIGGWLRSSGKVQNAAIIKSIACRITGYKSFNEIPRERLRNLIATFNNKVRDAAAVDQLEADVKNKVMFVPSVEH